jgi:nitroimidazol reductase NimA-like FMN-containing flavoprotein (pyridoxamine 5'-phosphate oxidase superfamily)
MHSNALNTRIDRLLSEQLQGVLATQQQAQPYTSLMAFAHTPDLHFLIFATYRDTQKHANLLLNSAVSFLIDDRSNDPVDYQRAVAISVSGFAQAIPEEEHAGFLTRYLAKHPTLREFATSQDCALLRVAVSCYRLVSQFQAIEVLPIPHPRP